MTGKHPGMRVVIDTNMLLACSQVKLDVFEETKKLLGKTEFFIPTQVRKELEKLAGKGNPHARTAVQWLEGKKVQEIEVPGWEGADPVLLDLAGQGFIIATNDRELRQGIKKVGGKSIYIRKRKVLAIAPEL